MVAKLPQALIRDKRLENLHLLPASQTRDKDALTEDGVAKIIEELRENLIGLSEIVLWESAWCDIGDA